MRPIDPLDPQHFAQTMLPLEQASGLPSWCYSDDMILRAEAERVFGRSWIGLGRLDHLNKPGDYQTFDIIGIPIFVIRGEDGELRAFANSCRHRGMRLLEGQGNKPMIVCPFHAWSYKLNGDLKGAPHMKSAVDFCPEKQSLHPLSLRLRDGFAFLALSQDAGELDDWLGDFSQLHTPWRMEELVECRTKDFTINCNWKLYLDVFNEYYHLRSVHPKSIGTMYHPPDPGDDVDGRYCSQFGLHDDAPGLLPEDQSDAFEQLPGLEGRNRSGTRYSWVFPNFTFAASVDCVWSHVVFPIAPDRTAVRMQVCFSPEALKGEDFETRAQSYYERFDLALQEDIAVLEPQQSGIGSPFSEPGRYCPEQEPNVAAFARWYAQLLTSKSI